MLYEVVSRRVVIDKKGNDKSLTEKYIIKDCELCSQAEQRILEHWNGENDCIMVKQCNIREFVNERSSEEQDIYIATIEEVFIIDDGEEKASKYTLGVFASGVEEATMLTSDFMRQGLEDFRLVSVKRTKYVELI